MEFFQILWFVLMGVLLAGFFVCAGFDFGIGMLALGFSDTDKRDLALMEIAPFWDGQPSVVDSCGRGAFCGIS